MEQITYEQMLSFDENDDQSSLLGDGWLCKGQANVLYAPTGKGKSVLLQQMAIQFAFGIPFFGMKPARPLKSVIIQSENILRDCAIAAKGICEGLKLTRDQQAELDDLIGMFHAFERGESFFPFLKDILKSSSPDLVFIDPLFGFIEGNVNEGKTVSQFCRANLQPLLEEYSCGAIIAHHENKVQAGGKKKHEIDYLGSGHSELANFARASMALIESKPGSYRLCLGKRGFNARLTESDSSTTGVLEVNIAHSGNHNRPFWERARSPESEEKARNLGDSSRVLKKMSNQAYGVEGLVEIVGEVMGKSRSTVREPGSKAYAVLEIIKKHCATNDPKVFKKPALRHVRLLSRTSDTLNRTKSG